MDVTIERDATGLLLTMPIIALAMQRERGYLAGVASADINRMGMGVPRGFYHLQP